MGVYNKKELITGAVMLAAGLAYLGATMNLPRKTFIDAAFVPYVLAIMLCALGVLQIVLNARKVVVSEQPVAENDDKKAADYPTVVKTLALITGYIALLNPIGFPIMTAIYLYLQFVVMTPADQKVRHVLYAVIALISAAVIFVIFRQGFDLMLPTGILNI